MNGSRCGAIPTHCDEIATPHETTEFRILTRGR